MENCKKSGKKSGNYEVNDKCQPCIGLPHLLIFFTFDLWISQTTGTQNKFLVPRNLLGDISSLGELQL